MAVELFSNSIDRKGETGHGRQRIYLECLSDRLHARQRKRLTSKNVLVASAVSDESKVGRRRWQWGCAEGLCNGFVRNFKEGK